MENPETSLLWDVPEWKELLTMHSILMSEIDRCQYDLLSPEGEFIRKPTHFVASHAALLRHLDRRCRGDHDHRVLEGSRRTKLAAVWPMELRNTILEGATELSYRASSAAFPATTAETECLACRRRQRRAHRDHSRVAGKQPLSS